MNMKTQGLSQRARAPQQKKSNIDVDPSTLPVEACKKCGSLFFDRKLQFRRLSAVHPKNPTGKDMIITTEAALCTCGEVYVP